MKIAVCLLTCERTELTIDTVTSFARENDTSKFMLLHADDASKDRAHIPVIRQHGYKTIAQTLQRTGVSAMTQMLFEAALAYGADAVLTLQNDWRSLRPVPYDSVIELLSGDSVYCVRLCGPEKSPGRPFGTTHAAKDRTKPVVWSRYNDEFEVGDIHWGHPPCVTKIRYALKLVSGAKSESVSRERSGKIDKLTARPYQSVFLHTGDETTPGFKP